MSGGSWDYVYWQVEIAAENLANSKDPLRKELGARLAPFVQALHDIEWVDSRDYDVGQDVPAIEAALHVPELNDLRLMKAALIEYLNEFDTPAPDLAYRASLRDRLRSMVQ